MPTISLYWSIRLFKFSLFASFSSCHSCILSWQTCHSVWFNLICNWTFSICFFRDETFMWCWTIGTRTVIRITRIAMNATEMIAIFLFSFSRFIFYCLVDKYNHNIHVNIQAINDIIHINVNDWLNKDNIQKNILDHNKHIDIIQ